MIDFAKRANVVPWPPIILVVAVAATWLLSRSMTGFETGHPLRLVGTIMVGLALAIDIAAMVTMHRAKTTILPNKGTDNLVTHGIFSLSRNPIYVANVMIIAGLGLRWGTLWGIPLALLAGFAMLKMAIEREEQHLQSRFGDTFTNYRNRVRRWI